MVQQPVSNNQDILIRSLVKQLEQAGVSVERFDTHISSIIVAGEFAYKFKKPVHFDFVDFSRLEARSFYCQEELRLNRRLAPEIYLHVVAITGSALHPSIDGSGDSDEPVEYAVKMRAFSQQALWSYRIERKILSSNEVDELAQKLAHFHRSISIAPNQSMWGTFNAVQKTASDNLTTIAAHVTTDAQTKVIDALEQWQETSLQNLKSLIDSRKQHGFVRECHGDLHGGNILTIDDHVAVFDCIEFNDGLRWIDVMDDLAFIYMDLEFHTLHALATRLLNDYLSITGDYSGVGLLRYCRTQRALVRAKVALLRAEQLTEETSAASQKETAGQYLAFALQSIQPARTGIIIMHGYSGSGKSTVAKYLAEHLGSIQIRSDVERKRMHGIEPTAFTTATIDADLYTRAATVATYDRLLMLARTIVASGFSVIVDAAFLKREERSAFKKMAAELGVPFFVMDVLAGEETLRKRVVARAQSGRDPSDADVDVLARQLVHAEAISEEEGLPVFLVENESASGARATETVCNDVARILRADGHRNLG
jgi:aminoglycoside phosphotransferase family enzyme/predicted kinase